MRSRRYRASMFALLLALVLPAPAAITAQEASPTADLDALDAIVAPDLVNHAAPPGVPPTREGLAQLAQAFEAGIPAYRVAVEDQVAEGDLVATRATVSGTHTGPFLGIPATGRSFVVPAVFFDRVVGGRVVEHWEVIDQFGILVQLGLIPAPGAPPIGAPAP